MGLKDQIGNYGDTTLPFKVEPKGQEFLYAGIQSYEDGYQAKVDAYIQKTKPLASMKSSDTQAEPLLGVGVRTTATDKNFFRNKFVEFMEGLNNSSEPIQAAKPGEPVKLETFLGKEGAALYKLALEEERYSKAFMDAVLKDSTKSYEADPWTQRPIVFVAGPSGAGKTTAAQVAVQKTMELLPKQTPAEGEPKPTHPQNHVVSVDNGVSRETSQMRKLAIQVANNRGFPGIYDLDKQSKKLGGVKRCIEKMAFSDTKLGVVIPTTFSDRVVLFLRRLFSLFSVDGGKSLDTVFKLPKTKPVFVRVDGKDPALFKDVVKKMGDDRAWEKIDPKSSKKDLDLNVKGLKESKAYHQSGYDAGFSRSLEAERWFKSKSPDNLSMVITNDLVIKKADKYDPLGWRDACKGEEASSILVSERIFDEWVAKKKEPSFNQTLQDYNTERRKTLPALLQTSAEFDLAIARRGLDNISKQVQKDIDTANKTLSKESLREQKQLHDKQTAVNSALELMGCPKEIHGKTVSEIEALIEEAQGISDSYTGSGLFKNVFSETKQLLNQVVEGLRKLLVERQLREPVQAQKQDPGRESILPRSASGSDTEENEKDGAPGLQR